MKQAIVVRTDIKMDKGKTAVQVAHASLSSALMCEKRDPKGFANWLAFGQKKVALKVKSEAELLALKKEASSLRIPNEVIRDAGLTQLEPGTMTALGIGPAEDDVIDRVVSKLKLL